MLAIIHKNERRHSSNKACPAKWQGMKVLWLPKVHRKHKRVRPICPLFCSTFPSFAIKLERTYWQCNSSALKKVRISFRLHALCAVLLKIIWLCAQPPSTHKLKLLWCMYLSLLWASLMLGHIADWMIGRHFFLGFPSLNRLWKTFCMIGLWDVEDFLEE